MMENQNERLAGRCLSAQASIIDALEKCLQICRTPMGFILTEWREGAYGAFSMGLKHGIICVGCCWAQMLIMFAVGVMNLLGMALITLLITLEKTAPGKSQLICSMGGILLIGWGLGIILIR